MIKHVVLKSNLSLLVANDWESKIAAADLVDVFDPVSVAVDSVGRETDQLDSSSCEFGLELCKCAEFGGADRCEVFGVGEEDDPFVADEIVEVDGALSGVGIEVGGNGTQAKTTQC